MRGVAGDPLAILHQTLQRWQKRHIHCGWSCGGMVAWRHGSSLRRWFFAAFGIGIISLLAFSYYLSNFNT
ncbi:hypothetical protein LAZ67_13001430 [Cordylochernes scorpioides]|uniref:Uncharacterized protein n=1 Tax=Cordylochernes scorpioides TaxID=51811 RepID=A0ABY6L7T5_9ARAC|nr:hypothetical protein LAZ67_13001430 [Cordylochernes scorpioides]